MNVFAGSSGSWQSALDYVTAVIEREANAGEPATVLRGSATRLATVGLEESSFDAVITDPPYYDNEVLRGVVGHFLRLAPARVATHFSRALCLAAHTQTPGMCGRGVPPRRNEGCGLPAFRGVSRRGPWRSTARSQTRRCSDARLCTQNDGWLGHLVMRFVTRLRGHGGVADRDGDQVRSCPPGRRSVALVDFHRSAPPSRSADREL